MQGRWNRDSIAMEIVNLYEDGASLSYGDMTRTPLLRAAIRHFGRWEKAIEYAGLDYNSIRRYKSWNRDRIIARIQELHAGGADLSWSSISLTLDPSLASAAVRFNHFGSWRAALEAAGLDYDTIRRYQAWNRLRVISVVKDMLASGKGLNAKSVQCDDIALITAARRRFDSWNSALTAAGIDYRNVIQRAPFKRGRGRRQNLIAAPAHSYEQTK